MITTWTSDGLLGTHDNIVRSMKEAHQSRYRFTRYMYSTQEPVTPVHQDPCSASRQLESYPFRLPCLSLPVIAPQPLGPPCFPCNTIRLRPPTTRTFLSIPLVHHQPPLMTWHPRRPLPTSRRIQSPTLHRRPSIIMPRRPGRGRYPRTSRKASGGAGDRRPDVPLAALGYYEEDC